MSHRTAEFEKNNSSEFTEVTLLVNAKSLKIESRHGITHVIYMN